MVSGGLKASDTVLLLGTGGVSVWGCQIAKAVGATVIITSSSGEKLERARDLGVDQVVNYRELEDWRLAVRNWIGGCGVDHVLELGGPATLEQSIAAVSVDGHIALIGTVTGGRSDILTAALMMKQARLQDMIVGSREEQQDFVCFMRVTPAASEA